MTQSTNTIDTTDSIDFSALREKHNTSIYSDKETRDIRFPLWALLYIYEKSHRQCYIDYMQGFKLLVNWLTPIAWHHTDTKYPFLIGGYDAQQIANILNVDIDNIIDCMLTEVLPRIAKENSEKDL